MTSDDPTDRPAEAPSAEPFALAGLLWCGGCGYPLAPAWADTIPQYACVGCRQRRVDATILDRLAGLAAKRHSPTLVTDVPARCRAELFQQLMARAMVGASPEDLTITWRS